MNRALFIVLFIVLGIVALAGIAGLAIAKDPERNAARARAASHNSITEGLDYGNCHTPASWKMMSSKSGEGFDHSRAGFPLTGRREPAACNRCHSGERRVTRSAELSRESPPEAVERAMRQLPFVSTMERPQASDPSPNPLSAHRYARSRPLHRVPSSERGEAMDERSKRLLLLPLFGVSGSERHPNRRGTATSPTFPQIVAMSYGSGVEPCFIDPTNIAGSRQAPSATG